MEVHLAFILLYGQSFIIIGQTGMVKAQACSWTGEPRPFYFTFQAKEARDVSLLDVEGQRLCHNLSAGDG